jgi:hypothetical protein
MEHRVESLETQLALIKSDLAVLRTKETSLPDWVKNAAGAIIIAIFAQTVTTVWWASELSARQFTMQKQTDRNTILVDAWPSRHSEVMISLKGLQTENRNMNLLLQEIRSRQFGHFKEINNLE